LVFFRRFRDYFCFVKIIALIPARYAATRFPGKLMMPLGHKTIIRHTYDNTVATGLFDEVNVVTDSEIIFKEIISGGGKAIMSRRPHESGSDRIAEAAEDLDAEVVVNVQGDEPFINKPVLEKIVSCFNDKNVQVASVMQQINDPSQLTNPNIVKVVVDKNGDALYFSRAVIPYQRDADATAVYYKHIGVYAFRKKTLLDFTRWPVAKLEAIEKLEQLRYLENGIKIKMVITDFSGVGIDSPEDLEKAKRLL